MRISDWSSDVCSSDLFAACDEPLHGRRGLTPALHCHQSDAGHLQSVGDSCEAVVEQQEDWRAVLDGRLRLLRRPARVERDRNAACPQDGITSLYVAVTVERQDSDTVGRTDAHSEELRAGTEGD